MLLLCYLKAKDEQISKLLHYKEIADKQSDSLKDKDRDSLERELGALRVLLFERLKKEVGAWFITSDKR